MTGQDTGSAVGVPASESVKQFWFVAIVKNNTEKVCAEKLKALGHETYVPIQQEIHQYRNGRKKMVDRILLRSLVLVHVTESDRKKIVTFPFIHRFMTDPASTTNGGIHAIAAIPDVQIATLKFMLGNSDTPVTIESKPFRVGGKVRVLRGDLQGLEGNVVMKKDETSIVIDMSILGCARVTIDAASLEAIQ